MTDTTPKPKEETKVPAPEQVVPPAPAATVVTPTETPKLNVFGRPREYDPAYHLTQIQLYLDNPTSSILVRDYTRMDVKNEYLYKTVRIPTIEGLASFLKVHRATIYRWADQFPDFCDMIEQLQSQQAQLLIENGLTGVFNSTITKLMMGKHGYKDQSDLTSGDKPITPVNQEAANLAITKFLNGRNSSDTTDEGKK